jgi:hypothetical protein
MCIRTKYFFVHCCLFIGFEIVELNLCFVWLHRLQSKCWLLLFSLDTMPPLPPPIYKFKYFFSSKNLVVGGHLVIPGCGVAFSFHGHIPSSPPLFS